MEEKRPVHQDELRSRALSKEDAYFKALEEERKKSQEHKVKVRRMVCQRPDAPAEGCPLKEENRHGLMVDVCEKCGGMWMDSHEIDLMRKALQEDPHEDLWHRFLKNLLPYQK